MKTSEQLRTPLTIILSLCILILPSCQKDDFPDPDSLPKGLTGSWVEVHTLADTLVFTSNSDNGFFILQKGFEIRNGYLLPVIGSTIYLYEISSGSIKLQDASSSYWSEPSYFFHYDEQDLIIRIGKFSEYIDANRSILTFRKIE
jgi:hypothetical protein